MNLATLPRGQAGLGAQLRDAASVELQKRRKAPALASKACKAQIHYSEPQTIRSHQKLRAPVHVE